jgi:trans-2,3-dihydro-3-hydroxyanthranilate isomerase
VRCYSRRVQSFNYVVCDVFTDRPLTGNQLAVFTDARRLTPETMQALACEMRFSETVFVLPAEKGGHARIRTFTPRREIPFGGHPTLGSAYVLATPLQLDEVRLETGAGIIPVRFLRDGHRIQFAWMTQQVPTLQEFTKRDALLEALGIPNSDLPVELYDNGFLHVFVKLPTVDAVRRLSPHVSALAKLPCGINVFAGGGTQYKTRMFAPFAGVVEDPATGSAAGALAVHLLRHGEISYGQEITIEQGAEIGRPSKLYARVDGKPGKIESVHVGGSAVIVARGEFRIP